MDSITAYQQSPIPGRRYSLEILQIIGGLPQGATFSEIYRRTHASKPCFATTIKDLVNKNYVEKDQSGLYRISSDGSQFLSALKSFTDEIPRWTIEFLVGMIERNLKRPIRNKEIRFKLEYFLKKRVESEINFATGYLTAKSESEKN